MNKLAKNFQSKKKSVNTMLEACACKSCSGCNITCNCGGGGFDLQTSYTQYGGVSNVAALAERTLASLTA